MFAVLINKLEHHMLVIHQLKHLSLAQWDLDSKENYKVRIARQHLKYRLY